LWLLLCGLCGFLYCVCNYIDFPHNNYLHKSDQGRYWPH
jgi:hypothetical protein